MPTMRLVVLPLLVLVAPSLCLAQLGPVSVGVAPVEGRAAVLTQPLVASVEPKTRSTLAAEQAGLVAERMFDEGQTIAKDEVLARMKTDLLEAQLAAAEAGKASAEAASARAAAEAQSAANELQRIERLFSSDVGTERELRLA